MNRYADIHCHSTLRPIAYHRVKTQHRKASVWFQKKPTMRQRKKNNFPGYTQTDYTTLFNSNTKLIYLTISPIEQGWFKTKWTVFKILTYPIYPLTRLIRGLFSYWPILINNLIKAIVHLPFSYIRYVQNNQKYKYFESLIEEYKYISNRDRWKHNGDSFELISHGTQLTNNNDSIQVILTIEGAHSFSPYNAKSFLRNAENINEVLENIETVKSWDFPLFFVTLCHHFNNGLVGHAKTIYHRTILGQLFCKLIPQENRRDMGINKYGWDVIRRLLGLTGDSNKRILIDVKHMSVAARKEYYRFVQDNNQDTSKLKIPIIFSHGGYSGCKTLDELLIELDSDKKYNNSRSEFNICSINLADDEIRIINESEGLIGINLDQRILAGKKVIEKSSKLKDREEINKYWGEQVFKNIIHIARAVVDYPHLPNIQKKGIWDRICIGSDFDGMINPVDAFIWAYDFQVLEQQLIEEFESWPNKSNFMGYEEKTLIRKILNDNAYEFAIKHYH